MRRWNVIHPRSAKSRGVDLGSIFGKSSEITLGFPIPPHSRYGMLPPALHLLQGTFVRFIATRDDFAQVLILRLYDLISSISVEREITWSTQLSTRHCFHESRLFL